MTSSPAARPRTSTTSISGCGSRARRRASVAGDDVFRNIRLGPGSKGFNYNFGELEPAPAAGDRPGPLALAEVDEEQPEDGSLARPSVAAAPAAALLLDAIFSSWGATARRDADREKWQARWPGPVAPGPDAGG